MTALTMQQQARTIALARGLRPVQVKNARTIHITYPGRAAHLRPAVRARLSGMGCACQPRSLGLGGMGDAAQVQSAASYAALGAKAGSIVPGIGNVVGAVIGLVVGAFLAKKKPVRASAEFIAQCGQAFNEYQSMIAQYPSQPLGTALGEGNLKILATCMDNRYGGTKDPRFLDMNWQILRDSAIEAVKKTFDAPPGTEVVLTTAGHRDAKGKAFRVVETRWTNTDANSLQMIADKLWQFQSAGCLAYHKSNICDPILNHADYKHLMLDLIQWAASTYLPQIEIPKEPTVPIAQQPPTATIQPVPTVPSTSPVPVTPVQPGIDISTLQPVVDTNVTAQTKALIDSLMAQGATQQQAFAQALSSLAQKGIAPSESVKNAVAQQVQSAGSDTKTWILYGGLGLLGVGMLFLLTRRRSRR